VIAGAIAAGISIAPKGQPAATLFAPPIVGFGNHGLLALAIVAVGLAVRESEDHQRQHGLEQKV
jgi:hypothetical protein